MGERDEMECAGLADVAAELALGALTGHERAAALAHLDRCRGCRRKVGRLMTRGEELLELFPASQPPHGFEARVLSRLGSRPRQPGSRSRPRPRWPSWLRGPHGPSGAA